MFNVTEEEDKKCWLSIVDDYATNGAARPFASEIINKMKNDGNKIYIITARGVDKFDNKNKEMNDLVKKWLNNNKIVYDYLIFSKDKLKICKENKIDIMIEDKTENINSISKELPVICFHDNHNKKVNGKNIYRAYSWYDVYYKYLKIKELKNEKN